MRGTEAFSFWRKHRTLIALAALLVAVVLWWLFRPELLFINTQVSQAAPPGIAGIQPLFTGSLHGAGDAGETHGRVNILKNGNELQLEMSNLESKAASSFTVALGPTESLAQAKALGEVVVNGHEKLALPPGLNPASDKTVLLTDNAHRILAKATLEPF